MVRSTLKGGEMLRKKRLTIFCLIIVLATSCTATSVSGITITEPKSNAVFHPGDRVTVKAVTAPNERPAEVFIFSTQMDFSILTTMPPYELSFVIPSNFTGKDILVVSAKSSDGNIVESEVQIQVVLPQTVVLKDISVDPKQIFLEKLPASSDPNKVRAAETRSIGVGGVYSDGVKRNITSSQDGTTYTSSNEKVATVSPEGKVVAQGVGTAKITVRNGQYSAQIEVEVDQYKE
jgi:hypothetical protein